MPLHTPHLDDKVVVENIVLLYSQGLISKGEARDLLLLKEDSATSKPEPMHVTSKEKSQDSEFPSLAAVMFL